MGASDKFCLRWNDFESSISGAFKELREDKDFFDVTLACDDDQMQAHKVILSACSPFFRSILRRNRHEHPLLYLKGVKYAELVSVLNFMYHGEVNVAQEELNTFLGVAEDLKVKGLTQSNSEHHKKNDSIKQFTYTDIIHQNSSPPPKRPRSQKTLPSTKSYQTEDVDIQEVIPVKSEPEPVPTETTPNPLSAVIGETYMDTTQQNQEVVEQTYVSNSQHKEGVVAEFDIEYGEEYTDYEGYGHYDNSSTEVYGGNKELDDLIANSMALVVDEAGTRVWQCNMCNRTNKDKTDIRRHVEKHFKMEHNCPHCGKKATTREALRIHIYRYHKQ